MLVAKTFTWDIAKATGRPKGIWYHAYVIIDDFSQHIVGHAFERPQSAVRAEKLIRETITRNGIGPRIVARR